MGRLRNFHASLPRLLLPLVAVCVILLAGCIISFGAFSELSISETKRANAEHQRVIIDAVTGEVSGLDAGEEEAVDLGNAEEDDTQAPDIGEPIAAEEEPAQTAILSENLPILRDTPEVTEMPTVARGPDSLVKAPAPEAVETSGKLTLPRRTDKGLTPAQLYGRGFARGEEQHLVSILITDAGFSNEALAKILALPAVVSVAVSPYAGQAAASIEALRNDGHEVWSTLPAVSETYPQDDPGPLGLLGTHSPTAAISRVQQVMGTAVGSVGMVLGPEETIAAYAEPWNAALTEITGRGLLLLCTRANRSLDQVVPDKEKQDAVRRADILLDSTPSAAFIRSKLKGIADLSAEKNNLIIVASARPQTLDLLAEWLKDKPAITLAPLSAIYRVYEQTPEAPEAKKKSGGGH